MKYTKIELMSENEFNSENFYDTLSVTIYNVIEETDKAFTCQSTDIEKINMACKRPTELRTLISGLRDLISKLEEKV